MEPIESPFRATSDESTGTSFPPASTKRAHLHLPPLSPLIIPAANGSTVHHPGHNHNHNSHSHESARISGSNMPQVERLPLHDAPVPPISPSSRGRIKLSPSFGASTFEFGQVPSEHKSSIATLLSSPCLSSSKAFVFPPSHLMPETDQSTPRLPAFPLPGNPITDYRRIEDHGVIGNCCTAALVGLDACIDWFCYPSFDSPSVFASVLDCQKGGFYSIRASMKPVQWPVGSLAGTAYPVQFDTHGVRHSQRYEDDTNILVTTFTGAPESPAPTTPHRQIRAHIQDFFPLPLRSSQLDRSKGTGKGWLMRRISVEPTCAEHLAAGESENQVWFEVECCPAFNYGMDGHQTEVLDSGHGVRFVAPQLSLVLNTSTPLHFMPSKRVPGGVVAYFALSPGQAQVLVLRETVAKSGDDSSAQLAECDIDLMALECGDDGSASPTSCSTNQLPHLTSHHNYGSLHARPSPLTCISRSPSMLPSARPLCSSSGFASFRNSSNHRSKSFDLRPSPLTSRSIIPAFALPAADGSASKSETSRLLPIPQSKPPICLSVCDRLLKQTRKYWRDFAAKCTYHGRWRGDVVRSILALKLLTFAPTGAIVAAPTCSLPESIGGIRNWDYRFTWIRDSSFILKSFMQLGYCDEARDFMRWLEVRCQTTAIDANRIESGLQIMYGLRGETRLDELVLEHFQGHMGSKPVRIGNAAAEQLQMDIYGELVDMINEFDQRVEPVSPSMWRHIHRILDFVAAQYRSKDASIWEVRGGPQDFTFSKVMCWVALDRGIQIAQRRGYSQENVPCWSETRSIIQDEIQQRAWNPLRQAFVQSYDSHSLDAACLFLALVEFLPAYDPRIRSTIDAILAPVSRGGLTSDGMVFRYDVETTDDGLHCDSEGTFSMCTLWAIEALARASARNPDALNSADGSHNSAHEVNISASYLARSEKMLTDMLRHGNHLGLFAEEIGLKGEALGNFPQGFTHLAIVQAALFVDRALDIHA